MQINEIKRSELPPIGAPLAGGFYAGIAAGFAVITAPKSTELVGVWSKFGVKIDATNFADGHANTVAMAEAGSEIAQQAMSLSANGYVDWVIPARDQAELQYRHFKPTGAMNYCGYLDGYNASSEPLGEMYTEESPAQTAFEIFRAGGSEAFEPGVYWTSTQYSAGNAFVQDFTDGTQYYGSKHYPRRVRPVRVIRVID